MTHDERLLNDIREANLSFLMLAQSLIRTDRAQALMRLGVGEEVADVLEALSPGQMVRISSGNLLMFRFRFDDAIIWQLLTDHGRKAEEGGETSASRLHASILMAGKTSEVV